MNAMALFPHESKKGKHHLRKHQEYTEKAPREQQEST